MSRTNIPAGAAVVRIRSETETAGATESLGQIRNCELVPTIGDSGKAFVAGHVTGSSAACSNPVTCSDGARIATCSTIVVVGLQVGARVSASCKSTVAVGRTSRICASNRAIRDCRTGIPAGAAVARTRLEISLAAIRRVAVAIRETLCTRSDFASASVARSRVGRDVCGGRIQATGPASSAIVWIEVCTLTRTVAGSLSVGTCVSVPAVLRPVFDCHVCVARWSARSASRARSETRPQGCPGRKCEHSTSRISLRLIACEVNVLSFGSIAYANYCSPAGRIPR